MNNQKPVYVIDTNILIDYTDIIPSPREGSLPLEDSTVDLSEAHLVIPSVVIRELSSFKGENSEREHASREVMDRLDALTETCTENLTDAYEHGITATVGRQTITVLPVHKNFRNSLPFYPDDNDNDGQIILTALTVQFLQVGLKVDGTAEVNDFNLLSSSKVVILSNKKKLRVRARERGIRAVRYGYRVPAPYTGRRDIVVPLALFNEFRSSNSLSAERFMELMPKEPPLVANEFIIMKLQNPQDYPNDFLPHMTGNYDNIARYDAETKTLVHLKYAMGFPVPPRNPGQAIYAEALLHPKISGIVCMGPAGSGKTFMATIYGYKACQKGEFIGVEVVPCENRSNLGALPGDLDEKMDPDVQPMKNALRNYLLREDPTFRKMRKNILKNGSDHPNDDTANSGSNKNNSNGKNSSSKNGNGEKNSNAANESGYGDSIKAKLKERVDAIWNRWFSNIPIGSARGRDFAFELAIYDEFQDQNAKQADTLLKRLGEEGKIILIGDIYQTHSLYLDEYNNGLVYASDQLYDNPMVAQVCFLEEEVIRHLLVKLITKRQESLRARGAREQTE